MPEAAARAVREKGGFDVERIDEIEREVKHDVIAFLTSLSEHVGPEARFVHQADLIRCAGYLFQCTTCARQRYLLDNMEALLAALKKRAMEHKMSATSGAVTAFTPSRRLLAWNWRKPMPNLTAAATVCWQHAKR